VKLPNGKLATHEIVKTCVAVAIVPLLDDKIIMVRQFWQACGKVLLEVPAGTLRSGENLEGCAGRELVEETGYVAGRLKRMFRCYVAPGYSSGIVYVYLATGLTQATQNGDGDEFVNVVRIDLATALQKIEGNEIEDAKSISWTLYLKQHLTTR